LRKQSPETKFNCYRTKNSANSLQGQNLTQILKRIHHFLKYNKKHILKELLSQYLKENFVKFNVGKLQTNVSYRKTVNIIWMFNINRAPRTWPVWWSAIIKLTRIHFAVRCQFGFNRFLISRGIINGRG